VVFASTGLYPELSFSTLLCICHHHHHHHLVLQPYVSLGLLCYSPPLVSILSFPSPSSCVSVLFRNVFFCRLYNGRLCCWASALINTYGIEFSAELNYYVLISKGNFRTPTESLESGLPLYL
jgi:hypothetical protein